jgi:hypothetical protein
MVLSAGTASSFMGGVSLTVGNVDQFTVAVDPDTINEEIVFVTGVSSDTLTIVRGRAGTSAVTHSGGATVKHVLTSDDLTYYTSGVDSAATLTGTQTLTNKTLTAPVISTISNTGTITLPTSTDTLVGRATTDTLTNKTLTSPTISGAVLTGTVTAGGGVGTNGQVLSSTGTGVQWSAGTTDLVYNPMASGIYYSSTDYSGSVSGSSYGVNRSFFIPFLVSETTTFDRIATVTSGAFSGSGTVRLAIYNNGTNMLPSSLVLDAGSVTCTAANTTYAITISQSLTKGWYWLAYNATSVATTHSFNSVGTTSFPYNHIFSKDASAAPEPLAWQLSSNVSSGYPATASSSATTGSPYIGLRKA